MREEEKTFQIEETARAKAKSELEHCSHDELYIIKFVNYGKISFLGKHGLTH